MNTFNGWFLGLPDEEQKVIREDKWMLGGRAYQAGLSAKMESAKVDRLAETIAGKFVEKTDNIIGADGTAYLTLLSVIEEELAK